MTGIIIEDQTLREIDAVAEIHGGYWEGEHKDHPIADWLYEVANGDTRRGYWEWCLSQEYDG